MKKMIAYVLLSGLMMTACGSSGPTVSRIDASTVTDLSGYWNDTDVRIVATALVNSCLNAKALTMYATQENELPTVIVGTIRNDSDEHLDASILAKQLEVALINSGKMHFVANSNERGDIRVERESQQKNASTKTAARLGNETGADFMLIGSIKTIVDTNKEDMTRTYLVSAELINIETNRKIWVGENSEIKKYISR